MGGAQKFDLTPDLFDVEEAPTGILKWAGAKEKPDGSMAPRERKKSPKTIAASVFDRARVEVEEMMRSGEWAGVGARHLVALYAVMHERVYGVEAIELGPTERYNASMMAAGLVKRAFAGSYVDAVAYMRWAWEREEGRLDWLRSKNRELGRRIGTKLMFGGSLVTDYRVASKTR